MPTPAQPWSARTACKIHAKLRTAGAVALAGDLLFAQAAKPAHHREQYDHVAQDGFVEVSQQPLSTFSLDVDTAAYGNVRRFLGQGLLPPSGMSLRGSEYRGEASFAMARELGGASLGDDPHGYRSEFVRLTSIARELSGEDKHASARP